MQVTQPHVRQEGRVGSGCKIRGGTLVSLKRAANEEVRARSASATMVAAVAGAARGVATGLPLSTAEFWARFVRQGKEMYKDPPLLPPGGVVIEAKSAPPPKQNALTGELTFAPGDNGGLAGLLCNFHPNRPVVLPLLFLMAVFQQRQGHAW